MNSCDGVEVQLPSFLTSVLDTVSGPLHDVGKLSRYPFFRRFGWPQSQSGLFWTIEKLPIPIIEPWFFDFAVGNVLQSLGSALRCSHNLSSSVAEAYIYWNFVSSSVRCQSYVYGSKNACAVHERKRQVTSVQRYTQNELWSSFTPSYLSMRTTSNG